MCGGWERIGKTPLLLVYGSTLALSRGAEHRTIGPYALHTLSHSYASTLLVQNAVPPESRPCTQIAVSRAILVQAGILHQDALNP
jgi:hypothetical protein